MAADVVKDKNEDYGIQYRLVPRKPTTESFRVATARELEAFQSPATLDDASRMRNAKHDDEEIAQVPLCEFTMYAIYKK